MAKFNKDMITTLRSDAEGILKMLDVLEILATQAAAAKDNDEDITRECAGVYATFATMATFAEKFLTDAIDAEHDFIDAGINYTPSEYREYINADDDGDEYDFDDVDDVDDDDDSDDE